MWYKGSVENKTPPISRLQHHLEAETAGLVCMIIKMRLIVNCDCEILQSHVHLCPPINVLNYCNRNGTV